MFNQYLNMYLERSKEENDCFVGIVLHNKWYEGDECDQIHPDGTTLEEVRLAA